MSLYQNYLPIFTGWTAYTPVIPKQYWDVYSQEERIKWLCLEYDKIRAYLDEMAKQQNELAETLNNRMTQLESDMASLEKVIDNLVSQIDGIVDSLPVYNPTKGVNETSIQTNRDMFRELAVFGARVDQMATLDADAAANTSCLEMAVIGNYTVFGNHAPRVEYQNPTNGSGTGTSGDVQRLSVQQLAKTNVDANGFYRK